MSEHIERARKLNRQASDDIDHGRLEAAKVALNEAIRLVPDSFILGKDGLTKRLGVIRLRLRLIQP